MKREALLKNVNFYDPQPAVAEVRRSFEDAAKLPPDLRLLELHNLAERMQAVLTAAKGNDKAREDAHSDWAENAAGFTTLGTMASGIGTGIYMGVSGGVGGMILGGIIGAAGGLISGGILGFGGVNTILHKTVTKYEGMSKDMRAAFKTGCKEARALKREIEDAFEETSSQLTPEICDASQRQYALYQTFPRLKLEMDMRKRAAQAEFAAAAAKLAAPEPVAAPEPKPRMEAPTLRIVQQNS